VQRSRQRRARIDPLALEVLVTDDRTNERGADAV